MADKKYIERNSVIRYLSDKIEECGDACESFRPITYGTILGLTGARSFVSTLPAVDVAPVVHGEWMQNPYCKRIFYCSECGRQVEDGSYNPNPSEHFPYCHCGARMDGERKEGEP